MTANTSSTQGIQPGSKVVVAQNVRHQPDTAKHSEKPVDTNISEKVLSTITQLTDERLVRKSFIKELGKLAGAVGVCFLVKCEDDSWRPDRRQPSKGRLPQSQAFSEECTDACDEFVRSPSVQSLAIESLGGLTGLFLPVRPRSSAPEIILVVARKNVDTAEMLPAVQRVGSALQLWLNGQNSDDAQWQAQSLAAINELITRIQLQADFGEACEEAVNQMADFCDTEIAAIGTFKKQKLQLNAISGVPSFDKGSETSRALLQAMIDGVARKEPGLFPAPTPEDNFLLQSHKQLASIVQSEAIFSQPLELPEREAIGVLIFAGSNQQLSSSKFQRFVAAAAPGIASSLLVLRETNFGFLGKSFRFLQNISNLYKWLFAIGLVAFIASMFLPVTYRVRCNCVVEPVSRRFAVAPFDGQIVAGHVEPGDKVKAGDLLAEMDGRAIRWELSSVESERDRSLRARAIELADRKIPEAILAELEYDRFDAEQKILQYQKDNLQITSPIDGVVLSGSLERAEAASVKTGQVLFEVGPLKPLQIEIAIPSIDIAQVKQGMPVCIWIEGQENKPIRGSISKIHPRSETRDARNVFVAELEFDNSDERLRPGMKGTVRIDGEKRTLGWSLFHKPIDYIKSRLTWW